MKVFKEQFEQNGYAIVKGILDKDRLAAQLENVYQLYLKFGTPSEELTQMQEPWLSDLFHQELAQFRV
jgi:ectoine hydroxylase-related dioxygenase (phytanoyl-CoA dioxygenase family)